MSERAAITGNLIDAYNVATHKCIRLEIDVPAEQAMEIINTLGWPTMVAPIPVAVARLTVEASRSATLKQQLKDSVALEADKPKGGRLAKQAGILCSEPTFWRFCHERLVGGLVEVQSAEEAAEILRAECDVLSRAELDHKPEAAEKFRKVDREFTAWCTA